MKNIILYLRVSTDEQADGCSLDMQELYLRRYCNSNDCNIIDIYKEDYSALDLQLFNYDNIFSLISLTNENYGFIEVFKEADFSQDDLTGIQSILKQVSSPLENAILYQEIKERRKRQ